MLASMQDVTPATITKALKDTAYVTVGFGVLTFQKAQVRRQELRKQLQTQISESRTQAQKLAKDIGQRIDPVMDEVEGRLPEQARSVVQQARASLKSVTAA
jgi:hypothetical protein